MSAIACAHHVDRAALGYCAGCGKALCAECLVRLSSGNYCAVCAETPDHRPPVPAARRLRLWVWVGVGALVAAGLAVLRAL